MRLAAAVVFAGLMVTPALGLDYKIQDSAALSPASGGLPPAGTILIDDRQDDDGGETGAGLIAFEDWARLYPAEKRALSPHPDYQEPRITVSIHGLMRPYVEKLHLFTSRARFVVNRPPSDLSPAKLASLDFLKRLDPSIQHDAIAAGSTSPATKPDLAYLKRPDRPWCSGESVCVRSRYQLEGKLPLGIRLANKLEDGGKKISETMEFESEVRALNAADIQALGLPELSAVAGPVVGGIEQTIFYVNQMMQFGKLLVVFQEHPGQPGSTVVTAFIALAVESDVLARKKEYETVPVLRNLVPSQVLAGRSSFNTGTSISAGLPVYSRNRLQAMAGLLSGIAP